MILQVSLSPKPLNPKTLKVNPKTREPSADMSGYENDGPFWGSLILMRQLLFQAPKGTLNLTTTHVSYVGVTCQFRKVIGTRRRGGGRGLYFAKEAILSFFLVLSPPTPYRKVGSNSWRRVLGGSPRPKPWGSEFRI